MCLRVCAEQRERERRRTMSGEKRSTRFTEVKLLPAGIGGSERRWVVESNAERLVASSNEPDFALLPLSPRKAHHCTRRVSRSPPSFSSSAAGWLSLLCECVVLRCCWCSSSSSAAEGEGVARRVACACGSSLSLLSSSPSPRSPPPLLSPRASCRALWPPAPPVASCLVRLPRFAAIDSSVASKQQQPTKGLLFLLGARALSLPRLVPSSLCSRGR